MTNPTFPNAQNNPAGAIPVYQTGGAIIVPTPPNAVPATLAASGAYVTGIMPTSGCRGLAAAAKLTQAGTLVIQRYIDVAGTIAIGAPISQVMSANTSATAAVNDGLPCASWQVTITNTSGSTGTLSGTAFLQTGV